MSDAEVFQLEKRAFFSKVRRMIVVTSRTAGIWN